MKYLAQIILKLIGWKVNCQMVFNFKKAVLVVAPHTSSLDFWLGRLTFWYLNLPINFVIKKEYFKFPISNILKALGGIPIDRKKSAGSIEQIARYFDSNDKVFIAITPEGTRKFTKNWKMGFYYIALKAKVPIILCYVDYKKKECGMGHTIIPTGNIEEDLKILYNFYKGVNAKYPEKFNLSSMYNNEIQN